MKASPILSLLVLLSGVLLAGPAAAEYPFDPLMDPGYLAPPDAHGPEAHLHDPPDEYAYDDPYPPVDDVFGDDVAIWPGWVAATYQPGNDRVLYDGEWFQPLYQDGRNLWYFDFRGQGDSDSASEFNLGTGVRILADPGWIFGAYAFWDHLNSANGNDFNQGTLGVEGMDEFWDIRFNVYFPESGAQQVGVPRARVSNGNIVVQTGLERAYWGFDFEAGDLLWAWGPNAQHEIRGFAGVYHFDHSANLTQSITGPRGRLEWRWHDLFGPGSRLTLGLTVQADRVRNGQVFGFIRLRLPLDPWAHGRPPLSPLHRRMLDRVVRDVDVISTTASRSEPAVNTYTGRKITGYQVIDANTPYVGSLLDQLEDDSVVVFDGRAGDVVLPHPVELKSGQLILGGGSSLEVRGEWSGQRATFAPGGARPTVQFDADADIPWYSAGAPAAGPAVQQPSHINGFVMDDRTQLMGVDITHARSAAIVHNTSKVLIRDVEVTDFHGPAISVSHSDHVTIDNVRIRDAKPRDFSPYSTGEESATVVSATEESADTSAAMASPYPIFLPGGVGILIADSRAVAITDSSIRNVWSDGIRIVRSNDVSVERTEVKNVDGDGIRLIDTADVFLAGLDIKNVGASQQFPYNSFGGVNSYRLLGGITLENTVGTTILDSHIHESNAVGIYGEYAEDTWIEGLSIKDVEHGIKFLDSRNVHVSNTTITLPDEEYRHAYPYGPPDTGFWVAVDGWVPEHAGIILRNVDGDVSISDSTIRGGYAGNAVLLSNGESGVTNLRIENNVFDKQGYDPLILLKSHSGSSLNADIIGNQLTGADTSFRLSTSGSGENAIFFSQNSLDGEFVVNANNRVILDVVNNHIGGDPMGLIASDNAGNVMLLYRGNTSTPGAEVIRLTNDNLFTATIDGNDHEPILEDVEVSTDSSTTGGSTTGGSTTGGSGGGSSQFTTGAGSSNGN